MTTMNILYYKDYCPFYNQEGSVICVGMEALVKY